MILCFPRMVSRSRIYIPMISNHNDYGVSLGKLQRRPCSRSKGMGVTTSKELCDSLQLNWSLLGNISIVKKKKQGLETTTEFQQNAQK